VWEHSIPPVEALRYSITFRTIAEGVEALSLRRGAGSKASGTCLQPGEAEDQTEIGFIAVPTDAGTLMR